MLTGNQSGFLSSVRFRSVLGLDPSSPEHWLTARTPGCGGREKEGVGGEFLRETETVSRACLDHEILKNCEITLPLMKSRLCLSSDGVRLTNCMVKNNVA